MVLSAFELLKPPLPKVVMKGKNLTNNILIQKWKPLIHSFTFKAFCLWNKYVNQEEKRFQLEFGKQQKNVVVETTHTILLFETANRL